MGLTREELKNAHNNVMTIMETRIMRMTGCNRTTANLVANEVLDLDREAEVLLQEDELKKITKFHNNEECADALFHYLYSLEEIEGSQEDYEDILHDINNLRGAELLENIKRTPETEIFFRYLKVDIEEEQER